MNPYVSLKHKVRILNIESSDYDHLVQKGDRKSVFILEGPYIWLKDDQTVPTIGELRRMEFDFHKNRQSAAQVGEMVFILAKDYVNPGLKKISLRQILDSFSSEQQNQMIMGSQVIQWAEKTQFCTQCSQLLKMAISDIHKICTNCAKDYYPTFQPVVIGLIYRQVGSKKELLLARGLPPREHYSCLAGHLEPGESLEACLRREIFEEAGVIIKNIRYFGSQLWPFPDQLMLGFIAEWESGHINIDPNEISDAGWYTKDKLPLLPPAISIARQMIDSIL